MSKARIRRFTPSLRQRKQAELLSAVNEDEAAIAEALELPNVETLRKYFSVELRRGKQRVSLQNLESLSDAARGGSASAARALAGMIDRGARKKPKPEPERVKVPLSPKRRAWWQAMWGHRETTWASFISDPSAAEVRAFRRAGPPNEVWPLNRDGDPVKAGKGLGEGDED
jgi:hypothetical protein